MGVFGEPRLVGQRITAAGGGDGAAPRQGRDALSGHR
jgi:hypothetical protein